MIAAVVQPPAAETHFFSQAIHKLARAFQATFTWQGQSEEIGNILLVLSTQSYWVRTLPNTSAHGTNVAIKEGCHKSY